MQRSRLVTLVSWYLVLDVVKPAAGGRNKQKQPQAAQHIIQNQASGTTKVLMFSRLNTAGNSKILF